jgi:hypothetical protein
LFPQLLERATRDKNIHIAAQLGEAADPVRSWDNYVWASYGGDKAVLPRILHVDASVTINELPSTATRIRISLLTPSQPHEGRHYNVVAYNPPSHPAPGDALQPLHFGNDDVRNHFLLRSYANQGPMVKTVSQRLASTDFVFGQVITPMDADRSQLGNAYADDHLPHFTSGERQIRDGISPSALANYHLIQDLGALGVLLDQEPPYSFDAY